MPVSYRKVNGVCYEVREGPIHYKYGDEYTNTLNIIINEKKKEAEITCLTSTPSNSLRKEINSILKELGVETAFFMRRVSWRF